MIPNLKYKLNLDKMEIFIKFVQHIIHTTSAAQTRFHEVFRRTPEGGAKDEWVLVAGFVRCDRQSLKNRRCSGWKPEMLSLIAKS